MSTLQPQVELSRCCAKDVSPFFLSPRQSVSAHRSPNVNKIPLSIGHRTHTQTHANTHAHTVLSRKQQAVKGEEGRLAANKGREGSESLPGKIHQCLLRRIINIYPILFWCKFTEVINPAHHTGRFIIVL